MCVGIGAIVGLIGTALSAVSQIQAAQAAAAQAAFQAGMARNNAIIAQRFAEDSRKRGAEAEARVRMKTTALIGRQRAVFGARNLDMGSGSALFILGDTAAMGELDALTTRSNYEREAIGFEAQKMNFTGQARLFDMEEDSLKGSMFMTAFSTILGGAANAYQRRASYA